MEAAPLVVDPPERIGTRRGRPADPGERLQLLVVPELEGVRIATGQIERALVAATYVRRREHLHDHGSELDGIIVEACRAMQRVEQCRGELRYLGDVVRLGEHEELR